MASDSMDSHRRKHRPSSPSDDDDHNSKRHKHRHHHRHHRHHHHRHDKNQDEESKEEKVKGSAGPDVIDAISANYDMEEGEIVEDEGIFAADGEIGGDKGASDVESGEIKVTEGRSDLEDSNTGGDSVWEDKTSMKSLGIERIDDLFSKGHIIHNELSPTRNNVNGDVGYTVGKGGSRSHGRSRSPLKESSKGNIRNDIEEEEGFLGAMEVDEDASGHNRSSPSHRNGEHRHRASLQSPLHGRYHYGTSDRNRSESPHRVKERSHSQSFLHEGYSRKSHHHGQDDVMYDHDKANYDDEGERTSHRGKDSRHNSIHSAKNKEIKTSNYDRYIVPEYTNYDRDFQGKEREKKIQKDHKGEKDQEHRRDRSHKDKERDREQEKEQTHSHGKDSEKEKELDRYKRRVRERSRDLAGDREWDRERRREKDRGRSKEREIERERRRDSSKAAYRDRDIDRDWEKGGSRDRKLEREREREKDSGRYNGRDRYRDKGRDAEIERIRRHHRLDGYGDGYRDRERNYESRRHAYDGKEHQMDKTRKHDSAKEHRSKDDSSRRNEDSLKGDEDDQDDYRERVELELAEQEEEDLNRIKEESRRRREAILQKYKTQQSQNQSEPQNIKDEELQSSQTLMATLNDHPEDFDHKSNGENVREPSVPSFSVGKSPPGHESSAFENKIDVGALGEGTPKSERSTDMFCDDIFGDSPAGVRKAGKGDGLPVERSGLHDNWDDPEGYYGFRLGEILDGRYEIAAAHGKGVFSTVVRARDLKAGIGDPEEVAIKIIRNNETMLKAGTQELVILKKLVGADPESRRHCVRYISNFKYRNHLCIVFESLHMNLREVLKKFGRNIGLKLTAVRAYAKQLFIALKHLRNCGVLHCDIKPDNMLVNDAKNVLKLCDFGNAMFAGKNEITPYLVSRFYRAPEIILGLPYDHPVDIWSVGCCLYELYSGKVLFPGTTNNDMLRLHMELKGSFPKKMLRKGAFTDQHFDQDLNFLATEEDPVTKKTIRRLIVNIKPKDISTIIKGSPGEDPKMLANFKDLLDKIFVLDPEKRLTVSQALNHPFITGK